MGLAAAKNGVGLWAAVTGQVKGCKFSAFGDILVDVWGLAANFGV